MARTHGKVATYNAGCRCQPCTDANTERVTARRRRLGMQPRPQKAPARP